MGGNKKATHGGGSKDARGAQAPSPAQAKPSLNCQCWVIWANLEIAGHTSGAQGEGREKQELHTIANGCSSGCRPFRVPTGAAPRLLETCPGTRPGKPNH